MALALIEISALPPALTVKPTCAVSLPSSVSTLPSAPTSREPKSLYWAVVTVAVVLSSSSSTFELAESGTTGASAEPGVEVLPAASVAVICSV
ncbi:hypothetical protein D3C77_690030 [compost metagenome]